ncbi:hypothetical protein M569_09252 [Genlisea aurea]|uniref:Uncharacterized protein n=1 Tax=Genlisea aurea TaxID=192259 RepID=S8CF78_9LAMI|nr:hypothetical protein M569_09252 [Genlisea aurea]
MDRPFDKTPYSSSLPPLLPLPAAAPPRRSAGSHSSSSSHGKSQNGNGKRVCKNTKKQLGEKVKKSHQIIPYNNACGEGLVRRGVDKFSGTAFLTVNSPPPSSLPLPSFRLRQNISCCKANTAGIIDAGATNNLRRLLRLR